MQDKFMGMLGLAMRAGKLRSGEFGTEKSVKEGRAKLVILAGDASDNTKKKFRNMCEYRSVPYCEHSTKAGLGSAIGKEERSSLSIEDEGFAIQMKRILEVNANVGRE
ncbi:MAG: L7Ae/L30e/S12e/Gadd45 family ribosomal protein [Oribacterium sp.]